MQQLSPRIDGDALEDMLDLSCTIVRRVRDGADLQHLQERRVQVLQALGTDQVATAGGVILRAPYLSREYAAEVLEAVRYTKFSVNEDEGQQYQIPECVLSAHDHLTGLDQRLRNLYEEYLIPLWVVWAGVLPNDITSLQIARYSAEHQRMQWHYDLDSSFTSTVLLDPAEGSGGIEHYMGRTISQSIGEALLFRSNMLHRSIPVTKGARHVLVHWAHQGE